MESPNNFEIKMAVEAQEFARLHFALCESNPIVIQKRKEHKHQRQLTSKCLECQECDKQTASQEQLKKQKDQRRTQVMTLWGSGTRAAEK